MSLSFPAPSLAPDPLRRLWGPVTVRVAWDLVRAGVAVRPQLLRAVREHALWRIPPTAGLAEAERWFKAQPASETAYREVARGYERAFGPARSQTRS